VDLDRRKFKHELFFYTLCDTPIRSQNALPSSTQPQGGQGFQNTQSTDPSSTTPASRTKASQTHVVQAVASSASLTTEVFPTVVPVTFTSDGKTFTGLQTVTTSKVVQATPSIGFGPNGNAKPDLSPPKKAGAIIGGAIGGLVILSLLAALILFLLRRRRRMRQEMDVATDMAIPHSDFFRPTPGTGWDVESASNRSSATSSSSGPFVKPIPRTDSHSNVHRKPVPGIIPVPTVSEDPFWDPSQQLAQVPITPVKTERLQVNGASAAAHNPFADPPVTLPSINLLKESAESGPSRLSTASSVLSVPNQTSTAVPFGVAM